MKMELGLQINTDMLLIIEKGIKEGICFLKMPKQTPDI